MTRARELEPVDSATTHGAKTAALPFKNLDWLDALPAQIWLMSAQGGRLSYANARLLEYTGFAAGDLLKAGLEPLIHPEDLALWQSAWEAAVERRAALELRLRLRDATGAWRWFKTTAVPLESTGQTVAWLGTNTDVHAHQLNHAELRRLNQYLNVTERLASRLAGAISLKSVAAALQEDSAQTFGAEGVWVSQLEGSEVLRLIGSVDSPPWAIPRGSALGTALHSKSPLVLQGALGAPWMPTETRSAFTCRSPRTDASRGCCRSGSAKRFSPTHNGSSGYSASRI